MSQKKAPRMGLLKAALAGKITNAEGALALHLSVRQFHRVKVRFAAEAAAGLRHRRRGRPSPRRLTPEVCARAAALDTGIEDGRVWLTCEWGATMTRLLLADAGPVA